MPVPASPWPPVLHQPPAGRRAPRRWRRAARPSPSPRGTGSAIGNQTARLYPLHRKRTMLRGHIYRKRDDDRWPFRGLHPAAPKTQIPTARHPDKDICQSQRRRGHTKLTLECSRKAKASRVYKRPIRDDPFSSSPCRAIAWHQKNQLRLTRREVFNKSDVRSAI